MIRTENLRLSAGDFRLDRVCLEVRSGEYFVLMGPTGSGKSLLLKCLCGLVRPAAGSIHLDGADITNVQPRRRRIGYVPQDCALFPHLNVGRNITFALRAGGVSSAKAVEQVSELVGTLGLEALMKRSPAGLSGGERQKVAVARALAARPQLLLLDEPVSALDDPTRREVCRELRRIQRRLEISTIHVCHAANEAGMVADRLGVLIEGRLVQVGTPAEVAEHPASPDVRRLLGIPAPPAPGRCE